VEYVREEGDTVETFRGESITVNLDNWSSIFMDGMSERSVSGNSTAYRFAGTIISRNSEEVTVLTGADITNPRNEEALWSLHASKLWLLPGNDWAILNAVLKVGNIPVLYIPAFYYPADEIVFHPVLGYRTREGTFLQTTTYILGRPKAEAITENSLTRIFGSSQENMEKKTEGVFLRSTGTKNTDPNDTRLSVLLDAYVNLGAYLGMELALPGKGIFGETSVSAGIGVTRDIYQMGGGYSPYVDYSRESAWYSGMFISIPVPFRYRLAVSGSLNIKNGSLSWDLPYYSDPYVDRDFTRRSEVLDWLSMLREGASSETDLADDTGLSSYEWRLGGSFNPAVGHLAPYISSLSVSSVSASLLFSSRESHKQGPAASPPNPGRVFFFPNRFTMYSVSASVAGTPLTLGGTEPEQPQSGTAEDAVSRLPAPPIPPWEKTETAEAVTFAPSGVFNLEPPVLNQKFDLPGTGGPQFSIDYRLNPTGASELQFRSSETNWQEQEDINWGEISTILSRVRGDGSIGFNVNHSGGGAYSGSFRLSGTGAWQDYMFLNEDAEEFAFSGGANAGLPDPGRIRDARNRAYKETYFTSSWDLSAKVRPFFFSDMWNNTSFEYSLRGLLAKTDTDTSGPAPRWDWIYGSWDKTNISTHQAAANIAANIMDYSQSLSFSVVLPPQDTLVSGNATIRAWISETSLRGQVENPTDGSLRKIHPVYFTETLNFGDTGRFQQYVVFDPEKHEYTTLTSSLGLRGFTASFSMAYAKPYIFNDTPGEYIWKQHTNESLEAQEFRLGYISTFSLKELWNKRLSLSINVNSGLSFDLQRYTNSRLTFSLGLNIEIAGLLDLSFSAVSENAQVFRYFQGLPFFDLPRELYPGMENSFFTDLLNSFRFDNEQLRKQSGFKLKSLSLSLVHHLGDWNAMLSINLIPYLDRNNSPYTYKFGNEVSFLVQWVPIGEIRTQIDYSKENLTVK
jgi:hypothetical protein